MGSEMCIRDSIYTGYEPVSYGRIEAPGLVWKEPNSRKEDENQDCHLYTSDAADERSSVDLGGRRIIKKKKKYSHAV